MGNNKIKNEFDKKINKKLGNNNNINIIYNQRPNSSRVNSNKDGGNSKLNNLIKNNNIIDKILNDNKRYFGFSNHPINVNINSTSSSNKPISTRINNITHGKNIGQFVRIMKPQKAYQ